MASDEPLLDQGAPDPGCWVDVDPRVCGEDYRSFEGESQKWQGPFNWQRRHGDAIVHYQTDRVISGDWVLLPDGTRGEVRHVLDFGFRRPGPGDPVWIYGELEVTEAEAQFVDGAQPAPYVAEPCDGPSLEADLQTSPSFLRRLHDQEFAEVVNKAFCYHTFYKGNDDRGWYCSDRHAARMIAGLRGLKESYLDFHLRFDKDLIYPDDVDTTEQALLQHIESIANSKAADSFEEIAKRLPVYMNDGDQEVRVETPEHLRRLLDKQHSEAEKSKSRRPFSLESLLEDSHRLLKGVRRGRGNPLMAEVKARLADLGWRRETETDRWREKRAGLGKRLAILKEIEELERVAPQPCPDWAQSLKDLPHRWTVMTQRELDGLTDREQEALFPDRLRARVHTLARTGRIDESSFNELIVRAYKTPRW